MRVALIDPSYHHQGTLLKMKRVGYFPLTLPRLAGLFPADTEITLIYEKCQDVDTEGPFDVAMFTTMGPNLVRAEELSSRFRARGVPTVVGGYSVPPFLDRCRARFDAAVLGDGEELIPRLLADLRQGRLQKVYRNLSPSLADLPPPRFDLVPPGIMGDMVSVETSRGCPNHCDFCAVFGLYTSRIRTVPVGSVMRDIADLARWKKRLFFFSDPNFVGDMGHAKAVLRSMLERGLTGARWLASVDIRALQDGEFLRLAAAAGCFGLQVGFETLQPEELRRQGKGFAARADYPALIRQAQTAGIPVVALMMVGFDTDTPATLRRIQGFLEDNHLAMAVLHPVIPVPGTELHRRLEAEGRLRPIEPAEADGLHLFFRPRHFRPDAFLDAFWKLNRRVFRWRSVARRFLFGGFLKNPVAYLILLFTNLVLAPRMVEHRLPMGMYE